MLQIFAEPFLQRALYAGILASVACGIIGTYVVVKQISSITGGLSHAAFGGVGLGYFLSFSPLLGAAIFCVISALIIGVVYRKQNQSLDTLISMFWSVGMALGILFISMTPGYVPDLNSYLFGSILFVPEQYLWLVAALDIGLFVIVILFFKEFQGVCFDEEFSEIRGIAVNRLFLFLLVLIALVVVVLIKVVGVILTIALLTTPAIIAREWVLNIKGMMLVATGISMICCVFGLVGSFYLSNNFAINAPTGSLIILLVTGAYILSSFLRKFI